MCSNHSSLRRLSKAHYPLNGLKNVKPLLAFSALLLFISDWQLDAAVSRFAQIASSKLQADETLGNVMGLNPFHDFAAWAMLKSIQDLPPIQIPPLSVKEEIAFKVAELKRQAGTSN